MYGPHDRNQHDRIDRPPFDRNGREMERNPHDRPPHDRNIHDRVPHDRNMHDMRDRQDRPLHDRPPHDRPPQDRAQNGTYRQPYNSQNTPYGSGGFNNRTGNREGGNTRQGLLSQVPNERYIPENARYPENSNRGGFSNRGSGTSGPHGNVPHFNGPNVPNGPSSGPPANTSGQNSWSNSSTQNSAHNSGPNHFNNSNQGPNSAAIYNKTENPIVQQVAKQRIDNHAALRRQGSGTPENLENKHKQRSGGPPPAIGPNGVPDSECYPAIAPHLADKIGEGPPHIGLPTGMMNRREGLLQQPNNDLVKGFGNIGLNDGVQNGPGISRNSPSYGQNKNVGGNNSNGYGSPQNTPSNGARANGGYSAYEHVLLVS